MGSYKENSGLKLTIESDELDILSPQKSVLT
jgi:hypothetical protein